MPKLLKCFLAWFPMLLLAVINGAARDLLYKKYLGDLLAHQVSTLILIILIGIYVWYAIKNIQPVSGRQAFLVGVLWLVLTLSFEFGFGRLQGHSWERLLSEYDLTHKRVWIFIPVWIITAPYVFYKIR